MCHYNYTKSDQLITYFEGNSDIKCDNALFIVAAKITACDVI